MKLQFPFSIGVFVASFGALGCSVSDAEIPDRSWWDSGAPVDAGMAADGSSAADSGSDGSIYGNDDAATHHQAGSGGGAHQAGSGGGDGDDEPVAGSGGEGEPVAGSGGDDEPVAGSGGDGEPVAGSGGSGGNGGPTCPTEYAMATHVKMNVTWPATKVAGITIVAAGGGVVHVWTKSNFEEDGNTSTVVSRSCGSTLPMIQTSAFAGSEKLMPEIPNATWEKPNMPQFTGSSTKTGNSVVANPGIALVGLTLSPPTATWPAATSIMGVDHDGDGFVGLAAIPKIDAGYSAVPLDEARSKRADRVDLAIRSIMTLNSTVEGCPETYTGTANVTKFDNHIIGCHVKGGSGCSAKQKKFVDDNRTVYTVTSATFTAKRVDDDATCADVRAAVK